MAWIDTALAWAALVLMVLGIVGVALGNRKRRPSEWQQAIRYRKVWDAAQAEKAREATAAARMSIEARARVEFDKGDWQ
jgi:hypothetical protein